MTDPCEIAPITIDSSDGIFLAGTPSLTVDVWQSAEILEWYDADASFTYSCFDVQYTVVNLDDSAVDTSVFTVSVDSTPGSVQTLTV